MGPDGDPQAVVDQHCAVYGAENVHVVDASIMPSMVCANTHLTVVMIGERAAALLRDR
jgi:choline dehydrogenase